VSLHATRWPEAPAEPTAPVPEMDVLRAVLDAVRAERTKARISQSRPLDELVLDLEGAAEPVRAGLRELETALLATARARKLRLAPVGPSGADTTVAGVRVEIVLAADGEPITQPAPTA
jgi:microcystin degradation protein MlrC